jgi:hypothetical protein
MTTSRGVALGWDGHGRIVMFGSLTGSMLLFILQRTGIDPASASAPFVAQPSPTSRDR